MVQLSAYGDNNTFEFGKILQAAQTRLMKLPKHLFDTAVSTRGPATAMSCGGCLGTGPGIAPASFPAGSWVSEQIFHSAGEQARSSRRPHADLYVSASDDYRFKTTDPFDPATGADRDIDFHGQDMLGYTFLAESCNN